MNVPNALHRMRRRLRALFAKAELDREMDEEMRLHVAMESEELVRGGVSAEDAARVARLTFGGVESHKETARDSRGVRLVDDLARDVRYAAKALRRSPAFAVTIVATLAVGIGATTLVFSAVNAIFLRRLAVRDADRVFVVQELRKSGGYEGDEMARPAYPYAHFVDFADATPAVFSGVAASTFEYTLSAPRALRARRQRCDRVVELFCGARRPARAGAVLRAR